MTEIELLKEQIRVAYAAYQNLHERHQLAQAQIKRLRDALDAATDVGIYPQSVKGNPDGKGDYEERTEYMNGWNQHAKMALADAIIRLQRGDWE